MKAKAFLTQLLAQADIGIDGKRPWDILVTDDRFYHRVYLLIDPREIG